MIYVDNQKAWVGHALMSHLFAIPFNDAKLHAFAARVGLKREWFQDKARTPHYDISQSKRMQAIILGARSVTVRTGAKLRLECKKKCRQEATGGTE